MNLSATRPALSPPLSKSVEAQGAPTSAQQTCSAVSGPSSSTEDFQNSRIPAGGTMVFGGETQCAWQGFSASAGNPLTVMESNV
jgi:hypothetical protein